MANMWLDLRWDHGVDLSADKHPFGHPAFLGVMGPASRVYGEFIRLRWRERKLRVRTIVASRGFYVFEQVEVK